MLKLNVHSHAQIQTVYVLLKLGLFTSCSNSDCSCPAQTRTVHVLLLKLGLFTSCSKFRLFTSCSNSDCSCPSQTQTVHVLLKLTVHFHAQIQTVHILLKRGLFTLMLKLAPFTSCSNSDSSCILRRRQIVENERFWWCWDINKRVCETLLGREPVWPSGKAVGW